jgi:hypothetical protein
VALMLRLEHVPELGRPAPVETAVRSALAEHEHAAAARTAAQSGEAELEQAEARDVERAASALREGKTLGRVAADVEKAKAKVEATRREAAVRGRAAELAQSEVETSIRQHADAWFDAIHLEAERARADAHAALAGFEAALARINAASSTRTWLTGALADGRFDRPLKPIVNYALSSKRATANGTPISGPELIGYLHELLAAQEPAVPVGAEAQAVPT